MRIRWTRQTARIDRIKGNVVNLADPEAFAEILFENAEKESGEPLTEEERRLGAAAYIKASEGFRIEGARQRMAQWLTPLSRREAYATALEVLFPERAAEIRAAVGAPEVR